MKKFFKNHKALCIVLLFDIVILILRFLDLLDKISCGSNTFCRAIGKHHHYNINRYTIGVNIVIIFLTLLFSCNKKHRKFCLRLALAFGINLLIFTGMGYYLLPPTQSGEAHYELISN